MLQKPFLQSSFADGMKKGLSIFFLMAFLLQSTGSIWIMLSFHIQRNYIAENICEKRLDTSSSCKGKCYLNKQLEENEKQEENFPDLKQKEMQLFVQTDITASNGNSSPLPEDNAFPRDFPFACSAFLFSVFHPPRLV